MTSEIVLPGTSTVEYDEAHTYRRTARFDHAGRPRATTLPRDPDEPGTERERAIGGLLVYNRRGLPAQAAAFLGCEPDELASVAAARTDCESQGGALQTIVHAIEYLRDGLVGSLAYGDDASGRRRTVSETVYDVRRRPVRMRTRRQRDAGAMAPEDLGAVGVVVDQELVWDGASNLVAQIDHRDPGEWPAGYRPQTVHVRHDALYRVVGAEFDYTQPDGRRTPSDVGTDWRSDFAATRSVDPMRQRPAPMAPSAAPERVASLTWEWDYLANTTEWTDDASRFYERSLGDIVNGDDASDALRPSALYLASNIGDGTGLADGGGGWVEVDYGRGGNAVAMTVHAQCRARTTGPLSARVCRDPGGTDLERRRGELGRCACASEQHYEYRWDELNRLAEARRYDREASGVWRRAVRQRYRYDASNQRTVKQTLDEEAGDEPPRPGADPRERIALYVYPGDFERRGLVRGELEYEASPELGTETQYLVAGARTVWRRGEPDAGYERDHRLTVAIGDLIQTTAAVLDVRTGALLEASTYYPNGARETFRLDGSTLTAPEVAGFTGKEGDEEVGLVYFGERYLIPRLGRWASPDPLHVHAVGGGEPLNAFHYISGNLLLARDPLGLDWQEELSRYRRDIEGWSQARVNAFVRILMRNFVTMLRQQDREWQGRTGVGQPILLFGRIPIYAAGRYEPLFDENGRPTEAGLSRIRSFARQLHWTSAVMRQRPYQAVSRMVMLFERQRSALPANVEAMANAQMGVGGAAQFGIARRLGWSLTGRNARRFTADELRSLARRIHAGSNPDRPICIQSSHRGHSVR